MNDMAIESTFEPEVEYEVQIKPGGEDSVCYVVRTREGVKNGENRAEKEPKGPGDQFT